MVWLEISSRQICGFKQLLNHSLINICARLTQLSTKVVHIPTQTNANRLSNPVNSSNGDHTGDHWLSQEVVDSEPGGQENFAQAD